MGLASASSPCLLPLYPAFIAYLGANAQVLEGRRATGVLGLLVLAGVLTTMMAAGIVLVTIAIPTSRLLVYMTPLVDGLLIVLGVLLIVGRNPFNRLPTVRVPVLDNPFGQAYVYGILLGPARVSVRGTVPHFAPGHFRGHRRRGGQALHVPRLRAGIRPAPGGPVAARRRARPGSGPLARRAPPPIEIGSGALLIGAATFDLVDKWDSIRLTLCLEPKPACGTHAVSTGAAPLSAWSRSAIRSSTDSIPTDRRTTSGPAPAARRSSSLSCRWVVEAGCRIRLRVLRRFGQVRPQVDALHDPHTRLEAATDAEGEHRSGPAQQVLRFASA